MTHRFIVTEISQGVLNREALPAEPIEEDDLVRLVSALTIQSPSTVRLAVRRCIAVGTCRVPAHSVEQGAPQVEICVMGADG